MAEHETRTVGSVVRMWPLVVLSVALVTLCFAIAVNLIPPSYSSTVKVLYDDSSGQLLTGVSSAGTDVQRTLATQADLVTADAVMRSAADDLGTTPIALADSTTVEDLPGSNVFTISVTGASPREAAGRAQRVAEGYVDSATGQTNSDVSQQAESLQTGVNALREQLGVAPTTSPDTEAISSALAALVEQLVKLSSAADAEQGPVRIISAASVESSPSSPTTVTAGLLGLVVGGLLGVGAALALGESRYHQLSGRTRRKGKAKPPPGDQAATDRVEPEPAETPCGRADDEHGDDVGARERHDQVNVGDD